MDSETASDPQKPAKQGEIAVADVSRSAAFYSMILFLWLGCILGLLYFDGFTGVTVLLVFYGAVVTIVWVVVARYLFPMVFGSLLTLQNRFLFNKQMPDHPERVRLCYFLTPRIYREKPPVSDELGLWKAVKIGHRTYYNPSAISIISNRTVLKELVGVLLRRKKELSSQSAAAFAVVREHLNRSILHALLQALFLFGLLVTFFVNQSAGDPILGSREGGLSLNEKLLDPGPLLFILLPPIAAGLVAGWLILIESRLGYFHPDKRTLQPYGNLLYYSIFGFGVVTALATGLQQLAVAGEDMEVLFRIFAYGFTSILAANIVFRFLFYGKLVIRFDHNIWTRFFSAGAHEPRTREADETQDQMSYSLWNPR